MTLVPNSPSGSVEQESAAVAMLTQAVALLSSAVSEMPLQDVVAIKAQVATMQTATRELDMSKEAQDLAGEAVRRAEWQLGRAIRKGQSEGSVAKRTDNRFTPEPVVDDVVVPRIRPTDVASRTELFGTGNQPGIYALADMEPAEFDAAIEAAKAEGNLSRANVARKAAEKTGKPSAPRRRPLPDVARDAGWDLRKAVERIERLAADDRFAANAEQVTPHLRSHLTNAIEVCQDLLDRINNN